MNGNDWLAYWAQAAPQQDKRKADWLDLAGTGIGAVGGLLVGGPAGAMAGAQLGGAVGGAAENAVNHDLTAANLLGSAKQGVSGFTGMQSAMEDQQAKALISQLAESGFFKGFAGGGMVDPADPMFRAAAFGPQPDQGAPVSSPQDVMDFVRGVEEGINGMPGGSFTPEQPKHPTLEMLANVLPQVAKALPAPRQTPSVNKTIGAWAPALATAFSAPIQYGQAQREERNKSGSEAARSLAQHRWELAKAVVGRTGVGGQKAVAASDPNMVDVGDGTKVSPNSPLGQQVLRARNNIPNPNQKPAPAAENEAKSDLYINRIYSGLESPIIPGRSTKDITGLKRRMATLHPDFNWSRAEMVYKSTEAFLKNRESRITQNQRNSMAAVKSQIDILDGYNKKWSEAAGRVRGTIRKANASVLWLGENGFLGQEAADESKRLKAHVSLMTDQIANVFMAGGVPSDKALSLAGQVLDANWSENQIRAGAGTIMADLGARLAALNDSRPMVGGKDNPYLPEVDARLDNGGKIRVRRKADGKEVMVDAAHADTFKSDPAYEVVK